MTGEPLQGPSLFFGALALSLCTLMQVLDYSIANVSIPYIAGDLGVSVDNGTWVITMFSVGNAIALPLTGWLVSRFGSIKIMVCSAALFTLFSWLCGASINIQMLIIMRFIQGIVAGPLIPLSQSLMIMSFKKEKKNFALAIWSMIAVVGPIAGPILGGWITYDYSWPWIFYINLPIGFLCVILIWQIYKTRETSTVKNRVDWIGIVLLAIGISAFQIVLDKGQDLDWWRSSVIRILSVVSIVSLIYLVIWELTEKNPIMDLFLFKNWNFSIGTILVSVSYALLFGAIVITPLWLQSNMGYTALLAGLAVSPMGILPFLTVLLVAKIMDRVKLTYLVAFTFLSFGFAFFLFTRFTTDVSFQVVATSRLLLGLGLCTWLAPLTVLSFSTIPTEKLASGQGLFHFFRIFFGGVGVSVFVTIWERRATLHHSHLGDSINPYNPISKNIFSLLRKFQITGKSALQFVDDMTWNQAFMLSTNDVFWVGGWAFVLFFLLAFSFHTRKKEASMIT